MKTNKKLYRVNLQQFNRNGTLWFKEEIDVLSSSAEKAIARAKARALVDGYPLRNRPIEVLSLVQVSGAVI